MKVIRAVWRKEMLDFLRDRRKLIWALVYSLILTPALFVVPAGFLMFRTTQQLTQTLKVPIQGIENAPQLVAYLKKHLLLPRRRYRRRPGGLHDHGRGHRRPAAE